ncbi:MAG TPA: hypothetical protein VJ927_03475 [Actinomycetota bacterium]|nr:hypothetical protein [Actinomycetota bacterium]
MAISEARPIDRRLAPILADVSRYIGRYGLKQGDPEGAKAVLRVGVEEHVRRVVQVYWTGFQAEVPGRSISLHLEVADPRVHWGECYLSPDSNSWFFFFGERESDGEVQLLYYEQHGNATDGLRNFFDHASWYVLTATDHSWDDVTFSIADELQWGAEFAVRESTSVSPAVQESLKKSTIMWLRWRTADGEHTMPVWYFYDAKAARIYVLSGERQQVLPGAERMRECDVILRWKGKSASVAEIGADVRVIRGTDPDWSEVADRVAEKRLNIPGTPEDTARRWRDECVILELTLRS